jgi:hypothetical protein
MQTDPLVGQLITGGTALAGFALVFLGILYTSYESFDSTQQTSVSAKYRKRAFLVFFGFLAALVGALAGFVASSGIGGPFRAIGIWSLVAYFAFIIWAAVILMGDFS